MMARASWEADEPSGGSKEAEPMIDRESLLRIFGRFYVRACLPTSLFAYLPVCLPFRAGGTQRQRTRAGGHLNGGGQGAAAGCRQGWQGSRGRDGSHSEGDLRRGAAASVGGRRWGWRRVARLTPRGSACFLAVWV